MGAVKEIDIEIQNEIGFWEQNISSIEMSRIDILELAGENALVLYDFLKQGDNETISKVIQEKPLAAIIEELNDFYNEGQKVYDMQVEKKRNRKESEMEM